MSKQCADTSIGHISHALFAMEIAMNKTGISDESYLKIRLMTILARTVRSGDCLIWNGYHHKNKYGYGQGQTALHGKTWLVHRLVYFLETGEHPGEKVVMHSCDNGLCININHLSLGTMKENIQDALRKGRLAHQKKTHCVHGHVYDEKNTLWYRRKDGTKYRNCRKCKSVYETSRGKVRWAKIKASRAALAQVPPLDGGEEL